MRRRPCDSRSGSAGFTLIEVIGALVIFAVGVLMVVQLNTTLGDQMAYAAKSSEIVVLAHERLDSLEALPFDSLTAGTADDTVTVAGTAYQVGSSVTLVTAILYAIDVTLQPMVAGEGPSYTAGSYSARAW